MQLTLCRIWRFVLMASGLAASIVADTASATMALFANGNRAANIARLRQLLRVPAVVEEVTEEASCDDQRQLPCPCPRCGGRMIIIEVFAAGMQPTSWPVPTQIRIDTS